MKRTCMRLFSLVLCCALVFCSLPGGRAAQLPSGPKEDIYVRPQAGGVAQVAMSSDHVAVLRSDGTVTAAGNNDWNQCNVSTWKRVVKLFVCEGATVGLTREGNVLSTCSNVSAWKNIRHISLCRLTQPNVVIIAGLRTDGTVVCAAGSKTGVYPFGPGVCDVALWQDITDIIVNGRIYGLTAEGTVLETGFSSLTQDEIPTSGWKGVEKIVQGKKSILGITDRGAVLATRSLYKSSSWKNVQSVTPGYGDCIFGITAQGTVLAGGEFAGNLTGLTDVRALAAGEHRVAALNSAGTVTFAPEAKELNWTGQERWTQAVELVWEPGSDQVAVLRSDGTVTAASFSDLTKAAPCDGWKNIARLWCENGLWLGLKQDGTLVCSDPALDLAPLTENIKDTRPPEQPQGQIAAGEHHSVYLLPDGRVAGMGKNTYHCLELADWENITAVSAGMHTVGLTSGGMVVAAGPNNYGQCNVASWMDMVQISAGSMNTIGLNAKGTVSVVGSNEYGQLTLDGRKGIAQVAAGGTTVYALTDRGTVVAAGSNAYNQCRVTAWAGITKISAGGAHVVGLKADGTVVAAGDNSYGQCNVSGWKDIVAVSAGGNHTVGLKADGTLVFAGSNICGQCDLKGEEIVEISAGLNHTLALTASGQLLACGSNEYGQIKLPK